MKNDKLAFTLLLICLIVLVLFYGGSKKENTSTSHGFEKVTENTDRPDVYLRQLRSDASRAISDSFNKYIRLRLGTLIKGKVDSANYYLGKADAYLSCENIVWPTYANQYPHPSQP